MFNLNEGDLKVAKNIWNVVIPLFIAAPVMYFAGIEFPFGFFNVVVTFAIYYALKLCTDQEKALICLLYTSPSPRDRTRSRMPSSA